jgi:hypothetical protein
LLSHDPSKAPTLLSLEPAEDRVPSSTGNTPVCTLIPFSGILFRTLASNTANDSHLLDFELDNTPPHAKTQFPEFFNEKRVDLWRQVLYNVFWSFFI